VTSGSAVRVGTLLSWLISIRFPREGYWRSWATTVSKPPAEGATTGGDRGKLLGAPYHVTPEPLEASTDPLLGAVSANW
jgi:hypothetical protein